MIDLHVHTDCSDGSTPPLTLLKEAANAGLRAIAVTDHDTLAGYDIAAPAASEFNIELICAVELSCRPIAPPPPGKRARSVHLLGYFLSGAPTQDFRNWLQLHQQSRRERNLLLIGNLRNAGLDITLEEVERYGRTQIGRPHFARVLLEKGYVATLQEAFDRYLGDEAQSAAHRDEPSVEEGIQQIRAAGGMPSLAHPVRLDQQRDELAAVVQRLIGEGLEAIEVFHSEHSPDNTQQYLDLARRFDLLPTGGSDYHGTNKPKIALGTGMNGNLNLAYSLLENMRDACCARSRS